MHLCNGQSCKCVSMCVHFLSVWCLCPPLTLCSYLAMTHPHSFIPQPSPPCSFTHIRHVIHCRALLGTTWPKSVFSSAQLTTHKLNHRCTWHLGHWQDIRWGQKNPGDEEKQWTFAVILPLWIWKPAAHTLVSLLCLPVKRIGIERLLFHIWNLVRDSDTAFPELWSQLPSQRCFFLLLNIRTLTIHK